MRPYVLLLAVLLGACAEPAVAIIGECHPTSSEVELRLDPGERFTAVGAIGEYVLVTTVVPVETADPDAERVVDVRVRWLDGSLAPVGVPVVLGRFRDVPAAGRVRWQRVGDALVAQVLAEPTRSLRQPHDVDIVHVWTMRPPPDGSARRTQVEVPVRRRYDGTGELWLSGYAHSGLYEMATPAAVIGDRYASAMLGTPNVCAFDAPAAILLFHEVIPGVWRGTPAHVGETPCGATGALRNPVTPWLVSLPGGGAGVLFRPDDGLRGQVHWMRLSDDLQIVGGPVRVGEIPPQLTGFGGQPRGVAFDDGHVVMAERPEVHDRCRSFRVFATDGSDAHDAPWKLPCSNEVRGEFGQAVTQRIIQYIELEPIAGRGAVVVYADAQNRDWPGESEPTVVRAALLTSRGQRGSETLDLSDPGGPAVSPFFVTATTVIGASRSGPPAVFPAPAASRAHSTTDATPVGRRGPSFAATRAARAGRSRRALSLTRRRRGACRSGSDRSRCRACARCPSSGAAARGCRRR